MYRDDIGRQRWFRGMYVIRTITLWGEDVDAMIAIRCHYKRREHYIEITLEKDGKFGVIAYNRAHKTMKEAWNDFTARVYGEKGREG